MHNHIHPLNAAFQGKLRVGATLGVKTLLGEDDLSEGLARHHFDAFTAENSMKPESLQPREGHFTFAQSDRLMELAAQSGAKVVGHALVWHQQTPEWFFQDTTGQPASSEVVFQRLRTHISTVVGRYRKRVHEWDVLNEVISDQHDEFLRPNIWLDAVGEAYIAEAFRTAQAADPHATLIYNNYDIESRVKHGKTLRFLKSLLDAGVPVHAVGIQGHWDLADPTLATIETAIENFAALGLQVKITELDVSVLPGRHEADLAALQGYETKLDPFPHGLPGEVAQQQAERYRELFALFLKHRDTVDRVTLWGVHDGSSWLNDFPIRGRTNYPLLFDRAGKPKAAFHAIRNLALEKEPSFISAQGAQTGNVLPAFA